MEIKEIFKEYSNNTSLAEGHYDYMMDEEDFTNACKILISFHVEKALKIAYKNAELKEQEKDNEQICFIADDMGQAWVLDKYSILNAYDLNNIK